ncbi:hypothetical protein ACSIGC_05275 [Tenacibaculum sp. ZS6-P6]|uniref:hypothetical protein n=1 Tax=Tenacibaculum sp. ZS6-P6 TaxID=3447503 RepID=UPI003F9AA912
MRNLLCIFILSLSLLYSCNKNDESINNIENQELTYGYDFLMNLLNQNNLSNKTPILVKSPFTLWSADLIAGQNEIIGSVTLSFDRTNMYVTYTANDNWTIKATHLYLGDCDLIPTTRKGNPKIGKFPYKMNHNNINEFTYTIPNSSLRGINCLCIATHAEVSNGSSNETAWGKGVRFDGKSWAMYSPLCNNGGGEGGGPTTN